MSTTDAATTGSMMPDDMGMGDMDMGSMDSDAMSMGSGPIDYRILNNPYYDYTDLRLARTLGYTRGETASIAKIARLTDLPFKHVLNQVHQGRTFALLASDYGLRLGDVLDASDEQARIDQYLRAYRAESRLGREHFAEISSAQTAISGPTLAELEARYNALNAAFPALPPTNIETSQIGSSTDTTTIVQAPPPVAPPPPPPAPPAPVETVSSSVTRTVTTRAATRHRGHRRHHRRHVMRCHHRAKRTTRMGS